MRRVAIDFGTMGIRVAEFDTMGGRIAYRPANCPISLDGLAATLAPFAGKTGVEVTLRCTNPKFSDRSAEFWNDLAKGVDCRWFRVLNEEEQYGVALGIARQLALEKRLDRLAVIDVGASQASIAVVGRRGQMWGRDSWGIAGHDVGRIATGAIECIPTICDVDPKEETWGPVPVLGIGGAGPTAAKAIVEQLEGATLIERESSGILPTVGILYCDIIRSFKGAFPEQPDAQQLRRCFLQLMDDAYDAITREGYDLDDAVCERIVFMQTADGKHVDARSCAMTAKPQQLANEFRSVVGLSADTPIHFLRAVVGTTIEPVKPALGDIALS